MDTTQAISAIESLYRASRKAPYSAELHELFAKSRAELLLYVQANSVPPPAPAPAVANPEGTP